MPDPRTRPKLVNRGPAGLLTKTPAREAAPKPVAAGYGKKDNIQCEGDVVELSSLTPDPDNARLHPERNIEAIKASLALYGQRVPLVVRKQGRVIVAGNGRYEAMVQMGWTKCAVTVRAMTDAEATGYGLADNRTAELARWDFETVARLDRLLQEKKIAPVGWSDDELEVLRAADWVPPPVSDEEITSDGKDSLALTFSKEQYEVVSRAVGKVQETRGDFDLSREECVAAVCGEWLKGTDDA